MENCQVPSSWLSSSIDESKACLDRFLSEFDVLSCRFSSFYEYMSIANRDYDLVSAELSSIESLVSDAVKSFESVSSKFESIYFEMSVYFKDRFLSLFSSDESVFSFSELCGRFSSVYSEYLLACKSLDGLLSDVDLVRRKFKSIRVEIWNASMLVENFSNDLCWMDMNINRIRDHIQYLDNSNPKPSNCILVESAS